MGEKTNFIFILLDDFGWKDLGCYGSAFYLTPHRRPSRPFDRDLRLLRTRKDDCHQVQARNDLHE